MLAVLAAALQEAPSGNRSLAYLGWGSDDAFFVRRMELMNSNEANEAKKFLLPNASLSSYFSASDYAVQVQSDSASVSGLLRATSHHDRDEVLRVCSEAKTLFTALHHPGRSDQIRPGLVWSGQDASEH